MAKIFVLLALLALSVNAATAITTTTDDDVLLSCPPMTMTMAAMEPCRQYMLQELMMRMAGDVSPAMLVAPPLQYQLPSPVLRQQCCMQLQGMMPRCQCNAMCQMMQVMQQDLVAAYPAAGERKMMMVRLREMAMRMPYMCGTAPTYCQLFPGGAGC